MGFQHECPLHENTLNVQLHTPGCFLLIVAQLLIHSSQTSFLKTSSAGCESVLNQMIPFIPLKPTTAGKIQLCPLQHGSKQYRGPTGVCYFTLFYIVHE